MRFLLLPLWLSAAAAFSLEAEFDIGEWPPYTGTALPGGGAATELVSAACAAGGIRPQFKFYPWTRAAYNVAEGRCFASFPFMHVSERGDAFLYSDILFTSSVRVLRLASSARTADFHYDGSSSAFRGFSVGTTAGSLEITGPLRRAGATVEETQTPDQSLAKLEKGRLDFVVDEGGVVADALRRLYPGREAEFAYLDRSFLPKATYVALVSRAAPQSKELLAAFNSGLAKARADGTVRRVLARHGLAE